MKAERALELFEENGGRPIRVCSPSGIDYWLEFDVVNIVRNDPDPLVYCFPVKPHPRRKCSYQWMRLENLVALGDELKDHTTSG